MAADGLDLGPCRQRQFTDLQARVPSSTCRPGLLAKVSVAAVMGVLAPTAARGGHSLPIPRIRFACAGKNPAEDRLPAVRRLLAIFLLTMLPLQFSWAAVASYCGHEGRASTGHFGHHDHEHHANLGSDAGPAANPGAGLSSAPDEAGGANGDKAPGAIDLDCGHCHGSCSAMLTWPMGLPGALSTALPSATLKEAGAAHAPTRPERPQWLPLA